MKEIRSIARASRRFLRYAIREQIRESRWSGEFGCSRDVWLPLATGEVHMCSYIDSLTLSCSYSTVNVRRARGNVKRLARKKGVRSTCRKTADCIPWIARVCSAVYRLKEQPCVCVTGYMDELEVEREEAVRE